MAALRFNVSTGAVALGAGTPMTVAQLVAPTNQVVELLGIHVDLDGAAPTATAVRVVVMRQTVGSPAVWTTSPAPPAPAKLNPEFAEAVQTVVHWQATTEPTYGVILEDRTVAAYNGSLDVPLDVLIPGGTAIGVMCNAPATVNVRLILRCRE